MAEIGLLLRGIARVCRRHDDNTITYGCRCVVYGHGGMQRVGCVAAMALTTMGHRHTLTPFRGDKEENLRCRSQGEVSTCSTSQSNLFGGLRAIAVVAG